MNSVCIITTCVLYCSLLLFQAKLIPVAYGIKKLQISCVVEDDKVGTDYLEEAIQEFDDHVRFKCYYSDCQIQLCMIIILSD